MRCNPASDISCGDREAQQENHDESRERRRLYKRNYMRRWRANPSRQAENRESRQRAYYAQKALRARRYPDPYTNLRGERVCGYCGNRPAVDDVFRLQICEHAPEGYIEVLIPYCGQC